MIRAVLDTNVFISALLKEKSLPAQLLKLKRYKGIEILSVANFLKLLRK